MNKDHVKPGDPRQLIDVQKLIAEGHVSDNWGRCFTKCLAFLLNCPPDTIPHFCALFEDEWAYRASKWLRDHHGVYYVDVALYAPHCIPDGQRCIVAGKSPRGRFYHAIVGRSNVKVENGQTMVNFDKVYDPAGGGDGDWLVTAEYAAFLFKGVL